MIPGQYLCLGIAPQILGSHIAWDLGARYITRQLTRHLHCTSFIAKYSRLLIDLNRSTHHTRLIPAVSFGVPIPGNTGLTPVQKRERLRRYYLPYRSAVFTTIRARIATAGKCLHCSVHSFTPVVDGYERRADIGLLYDPQRRWEAQVVAILADTLRTKGLQVRRNYPYRGTSDGLTTACRRLFPTMQYCGLEIEINQRLLVHERTKRRLARCLIDGIMQVLPTTEN